MLGHEAAERATKSRKVDLSHLTGFHLRCAQKMRSGLTCNWCFRLHLEVLEWQKESFPLRSTKIIERVCVSSALIERANLFTLY